MSSVVLKRYLVFIALLFSGTSPAAPGQLTPGSWTLVILPDTQYYSEQYPEIFTMQTRWIANNASRYNIKYVLHEGDLTNNNSVLQWNNAATSLDVLNGNTPYALSLGNHDYGMNNGDDRESLFNLPEYFGNGSTYATQPSIGGFYEMDRTDNSWHTFQAGDEDWLIISLEFGPRDDVLAWADNIISDHPDHNTILLTHAYLYHDDSRYDWSSKGIAQSLNPHFYGMASLPDGVNDGQEIWDELVKLHPNFRFVFSGHVLGDGTGYLADVGVNGNVVHQILANYQILAEGGQGYLRLIEFKPDGATVSVHTYSPYLNQFLCTPDQSFNILLPAVVYNGQNSYPLCTVQGFGTSLSGISGLSASSASIAVILDEVSRFGSGDDDVIDLAYQIDNLTDKAEQINRLQRSGLQIGSSLLDSALAGAWLLNSQISNQMDYEIWGIQRNRQPSASNFNNRFTAFSNNSISGRSGDSVSDVLDYVSYAVGASGNGVFNYYNNNSLKFFIAASGEAGDFDATPDSPAYDLTAAILTAGLEKGIGENLRAGVSGHYTKLNSKLNSGLSKADMESYSISGFMVYRLRGLLVDSTVSYSWNDYEYFRNPVDGITARADTKGNTVASAFRLSLPLPVGESLAGPVVQVRYINAGVDGYTETNAGGISLGVNGVKNQSMSVMTGVRGTTAFESELLSGNIHGYLGYVHDFLGKSGNINAYFTGAPELVFSTPVAGMDNNHIEAGIGVSLNINDKLDINMEYRGLLNTGRYSLMGMHVSASYLF